MCEALAEARRRLGDQAAIIHTRQYDVPVLFGLLRRRSVEILAADTSTAASALVTADNTTPMANVERQVVEIRKTLEELMSGLAVARCVERPPAIERLVRNGVPETIVGSVLPDADIQPDRALEAIADRIRCAGGLKCDRNQVRVALIGPTGVGKTTTAAKLAAQYSLMHKKKVALVTLDTYRIGAVEQLAAYARIMNVPMEVALSTEDGEALVAKHADKDLIIIDTVGRSQRNGEQISELDSFLKATQPTEVHLVLSASADSAARREAVTSFGRLGLDRLILTKLDECPQTGCILELAVTALLPFSYVTYGQDVPNDIAVADSNSLAMLVWEGAL